MRKYSGSALGEIDGHNPVNWDHALNRGKRFWFLPLPNRFGGLTAWDLTRELPGALTPFPTGYGWNVKANRGEAGSIYFNGTGSGTASGLSYVNFGNSSLLNPTGPCTFAASLYATANSDSNGVFVIGRDDATLGRSYAMGSLFDYFALQVNGTNVIVHGGAGSPPAISLNTWYRLVCVGDGTYWTMYIDGAQVTQVAWLAPAATTGPTYIGGRSYSGYNGIWPGLVGNVSISDIPWTPDDAALDYELSQQGYPGVLNRRSRKVYGLPLSITPSLPPRYRWLRPALHPAYYQ